MTDQLNIENLKNTACFTYSVNMVVQIMAPNEELAREKLDRDGGYVSKRSVELLDSIHIYTDDTEKDAIEDPKTD
jgi:hypothetical protein